ncbi:MAG: DUF3800 domain-containing protein [Spirochaetae bacterium HGW-Spirochaetae-4]|nr:MAG: DUF3800 domain-containing protein [Spirochaetae bacterium HGW-Spirochaetae-4]
MSETYNIYCDETCHLEHDVSKVMVLGAVWCEQEKVEEIGHRMKEIRIKYGIPPYLEIKWVKVSPAQKAFYLDIIDYFLDDDDLHFRGIIIPDKTKLNHQAYNQTHDDWYYKMFFDLIKVIISPEDRYNIFLDYKDTWGAKKIQKLHNVLSNSTYDFSREIVQRIQLVRSHQVQLIQLCDLLIGAIEYKNRHLSESDPKAAIVARLIERTGYSLEHTTLLKEKKMNLLRWNGADV